MIAKVKSSNFIDTLKVELLSCTNHCLKAVLRDDKGSVCSELETILMTDQPEIPGKVLMTCPMAFTRLSFHRVKTKFSYGW